MDVKNYIAKKAAGLATLAKVGDAYAVSYKQFDPSTGEELTPQVIAVSLDDLNSQLADLQGQEADINQVISDIEKI